MSEQPVLLELGELVTHGRLAQIIDRFDAGR